MMNDDSKNRRNQTPNSGSSAREGYPTTRWEREFLSRRKYERERKRRYRARKKAEAAEKERQEKLRTGPHWRRPHDPIPHAAPAPTPKPAPASPGGETVRWVRPAVEPEEAPAQDRHPEGEPEKPR